MAATNRAPTPRELSKLLGRNLQVEELLGQGGMGVVYRATQTKLNRQVAIKVLFDLDLASDLRLSEQFQREAESQASLDHPNVVRIYDFDETTDGHPYFVMEFVDGTDLYSLIHRSTLTKVHVLSWIPQVCLALQHAHDRGVLHRDVKPGNIFVCSTGHVKIGDFGMAQPINLKESDENSRLPLVNGGTADYTAPEAIGHCCDIDGRADIYSLGVVLYEMLAGAIPPRSTQSARLPPDVDPGFDTIVKTALQLNRELRYQSALEFHDAMVTIAEELQSFVAIRSGLGAVPNVRRIGRRVP